MISFDKGNSNEAVAAYVLEFLQFRLFDPALFRSHKEVHGRIHLIEINQGIYFFPTIERQQINRRDSLGIPAVGFGNFICLETIDAAQVGKEEYRVQRRGIEQMIDCIFIFRTHSLDAAAAFILCMVDVGVDALDIATPRQSQNHAFIRNHIFHAEFRRISYNLSTPRISKLLLSIEEFIFDNTHDFMRIGKDIAQIGNPFFQFLVFLFDFFPFQTGQAAQTHIEDSNGLLVAQAELAHERRLGNFIRLGFADRPDNLVNMVEGDKQTFQYVGTGQCLFQFKFAPSGYDILLMSQVIMQYLFQRQDAWMPIDKRQHNNAKRFL